MDKRSWLIAGAIVLFILGMTYAVRRFEGIDASMIFIGLLLLLFGVIAIVVKAGNTNLPFESKVVDRARGVVRLRFRNTEYGRLVARQAKESSDDYGTRAAPGSSSAIQE